MSGPPDSIRAFIVILVLALVTRLQANTSIFELIRNDPPSAVRVIRADPALVTVRDSEGSTPLMLAARLGNQQLVEQLLSLNADPAITNAAGATALMWSVAYPRIVQALLQCGADPNVRSTNGSTALLIASKRMDSYPSAKQLLANGADVHASDLSGFTPLLAAAQSADARTVQLLIRRGAYVNVRAKPFSLPGQPPASEQATLPSSSVPGTASAPSLGGSTPLIQAAWYGQRASVRILLRHGANVNDTSDFGTALHLAAYRDEFDIASELLNAGAELNPLDGYKVTPLMWACLTESNDPRLVRLLLRRGAALTAVPDGDPDLPEWTRQPVGWAQQKGNTRILQHLLARGEKPTFPPVRKEIPRNSIVALSQQNLMRAGGVALAQLVRSEATFRSKRTCVSCHHQAIPSVALELTKGFEMPFGSEAGRQVTASIADSWGEFADSMFEMNEGLPNSQIGAGYAAWALAANRHPPSRTTDAIVHYLSGVQRADGHWRSLDRRPPQEGSDFTATALSVLALREFAAPAMRIEADRRIRSAKRWLERSKPQTTEDASFRLLGLVWSGAAKKQISKASELIMRSQNSDGGWPQLSTLPSDAYATGQAVYALLKAGASPAQEAIERGLSYLLQTQFPDGSWYVHSRAFPFQPRFNSDFPHGRHQFISAAGSSWAALALLTAHESLRQEQTSGGGSAFYSRSEAPVPLPSGSSGTAD